MSHGGEGEKFFLILSDFRGENKDLGKFFSQSQ
jgi:hypothetical protein